MGLLTLNLPMHQYRHMDCITWLVPAILTCCRRSLHPEVQALVQKKWNLIQNSPARKIVQPPKHCYKTESEIQGAVVAKKWLWDLHVSVTLIWIVYKSFSWKIITQYCKVVTHHFSDNSGAEQEVADKFLIKLVSGCWTNSYV